VSAAESYVGRGPAGASATLPFPFTERTMPATPFVSRASAAILAAVLSGVAAPSAALACSCSPMSPEQHVRLAPAIFEGRVLEVRRSRLPGLGFDDVAATLQVSARWKGDVADRVQVHGHEASSMCGYARFPAGEALLVLAYPRADGDGFTTNICAMAPTFGEARSALGNTLGRIARERELLEEAVAEAPRTVLPVVRLARHLEEWRDLPAAARAYASAGRAVPELQPAHAGEGRALFALGRYRDAIPPLARAAALQPPDTETARLLGQARFHAGDRTGVERMDFRGFEARDLDLGGRDLGGRDFSGARLQGVRFDGAHLVGARFARASVAGSFVGADLSGADLAQAQIGNDLSRARLDGAGLAGASLFGAVLRGASLRGVSGQDANLGHTEAAGAVLADARLPLALLHSADLTHADLTGASLVGTFLAGARLCGANLSGADLRGADLRGASFDAKTRLPEGFDPTEAGMVSAEGSDCRPPR
jgi:uncharacterized protein YjbI with pentapeptide repeats